MKEFKIDNSPRGVIAKELIAIAGYGSLEAYQHAKGLLQDNLLGQKTYDSLYHTILRVSDYHFTDYIDIEYPKKHIVWHHSAGWDNARGMFDIWYKDKRKAIATAIGIDDNGNVIRGFDERYWAYNTGMGYSFDKHVVAVEICNFGALKCINDEYFAWPNNYGTTGRAISIQKEKVAILDKAWRGFRYYEKYTDRELDALKKWTMLNSIRFDVSLKSDPERIYTYDPKYPSEYGLCMHCTLDAGKTDLYPDPRIIYMLNQFNEIYR